MRVEVKFHRSSQPDLLRWRRTFGPRGQDRTDQFQVAVELLRDRFAEFNGLPPDSVSRLPLQVAVLGSVGSRVHRERTAEAPAGVVGRDRTDPAGGSGR